ncbi:MAG: MMPL family transporter, partial [Myxococcota bacterium]|nr:MMPL family transporter [Myxococcota bacterium]
MIRKRLFELLAALAAHHGRWVLAAGVLLTLVSIPLAARIQPDTSFKGMMGENEPVAQKAAYMEDNFPAASALQVLLEGRDESRVIEVAQLLRDQLLEEPDRVQSVFLELPVDFFLEHGLLYMPTQDLRLMTAGIEEWEGSAQRLLADPSLMGLFGLMGEVAGDQSRSASAVTTVNTKLFGRLLLEDQGPFDGPGVEMGMQVDSDPMRRSVEASVNRSMQDTQLPGSSEQVLSLLTITHEGLDLLADVLDEGRRITPEQFHQRVVKLRELDLSRMGGELNRYQLSQDRTAILLEIVSTDNVQYIEKAGPFVQWLEDQMEQVRTGNPDVTMAVTGLPVMAVEETQAITDNFLFISILGLVGILAVFVIGFERVGLPMLAGIPLVMGVIWTAGTIGLLRGTVTLMAMAFPVLMLGIGIDFAIHILSGYSEQRRKGHPPFEALRETYDRIGSGLITGAVTTAAAFLVLLT